MADIENLSKQLNSLIPDLYYDLIARVVPGGAILTVVIGSLKGWGYLLSIPQTVNIGSATVFLIESLIAAYLAATLCLPIGELGRYLLTPFLWRAVVSSSPQLVVELEDELNLKGLAKTWSPSRINGAYRLVHERLRSIGERAVVLSKMQAETALSTVLLGFFLLWLGATLFRYFLPQQALLFFEKPSVFAIGPVGLLLSLSALTFRGFRLWNKHLSMLHEDLRKRAQHASHAAAH